MEQIKSDQITNNGKSDIIDIDKIRDRWKFEAYNQKQKRPYISRNLMSESQFFSYIEGLGSIVMIKQNDFSKFVFDNDNQKIINNLYLYVVYDKQCEWDLDKGILFYGSIGSGKTVLLKSFVMLLNELASIDKSRVFEELEPIKFYTSQDLIDRISKENARFSYNYFDCALCIDDLGREPKKVCSYGNDLTPMLDLLMYRYEKGLPTYGTSNFKFETLSRDNMYGPVIGDRLKTMMNFVEMVGKSRRK